MRIYLAFILSFLTQLQAQAQELPYQYTFFDNSLMSKNYFYSEVQYTAPSWVLNSQKRLPISEDVFFTPGNSLMLQYISAPQGTWQAEIQYHPLRGNDFFSAADVLSLRLYIKDSMEISALPQLALRKTDTTFTQYIKLSQYLPAPNFGQWNRIVIPLRDLGIGTINNSIIKTLAAVCFQQNHADGKLHTLYIDQVELLPSISVAMMPVTPKLVAAKGYERHIDLTWEATNTTAVKYYKIYRSFDGQHFTAIGIRAPFFTRYTDFIGEVDRKAWYKICAVDLADNESEHSEVLNASTHSMSDEHLLDMMQEAHFRYYWDGAEPNSGLAKENIPGRHSMVATGASGFGLMALIVGVERGFITREQAVERFNRILTFLEKADKFHGAVSHFIDGTTGKAEPFFGPVDNGGDLVETSFLFQGLLTAHQYFNKSTPEEKQIRQSIDRLWRGVEWSWYRKDKDDNFLTWHWSKEHGWKINHQLIGWNEAMITYILAMASPTKSVPISMYYTGWAGQSKQAKDYRRAWGGTSDGEDYTNGKTYYGAKLNVGVSNGGPLFFVHYSYFGLNPHLFTDKYTNYFENNRNISLINHRYCVENPNGHQGYGVDCWGLSASDFAWNYQAQEPIASRDNGTIPPNAAIASMPYTPEESMAALKNYYRNYGSFLWGEYGFRDAFNLSENWCTPIYMGLNQAPVTIMIENYRTGLLWNLFMSHPDIKRWHQEWN